MHFKKLSYLIEHPGRSQAVPRSTTEVQWLIAATPESPSLLEGFVALARVVTLKTRMIALATPPSALIVDPLEAKVLALARTALLEVVFGVVGRFPLFGGVLVVESGAIFALVAGAPFAVPGDGVRLRVVLRMSAQRLRFPPACTKKHGVEVLGDDRRSDERARKDERHQPGQRPGVKSVLLLRRRTVVADRLQLQEHVHIGPQNVVFGLISLDGDLGKERGLDVLLGAQARAQIAQSLRQLARIGVDRNHRTWCRASCQTGDS